LQAQTGLPAATPGPSGGGGLPSSLRSSPGQPGGQAPRPARRCVKVKRTCVPRAGHVACLPCPITRVIRPAPVRPPPWAPLRSALTEPSSVNLGRARLCRCARCTSGAHRPPPDLVPRTTLVAVRAPPPAFPHHRPEGRAEEEGAAAPPPPRLLLRVAAFCIGRDGSRLRRGQLKGKGSRRRLRVVENSRRGLGL